MRYIRNISDNQNKAGDTDNIFRFNLLQDEDIFNFGDYPISINIANSSGYILSMVPEKEFGNSVLKLDFNDQSLKSLTPDNYLLEVEVKFPDGTTATFPTKGGMPFTVNSNLKNTAGQLVPTVTFDEVLSAVDKKVNNYLETVQKGNPGEKGEKGDPGVVDTAKYYTWTGTNTFNKKIIAPAGIQGNADTATKLQTPIIIGGRNLVLGTSNQVVQANTWNMQVANINYDKSLGSSLCASVMINNADHASYLLRGSASIVLYTYDKSGNILSTSYGNRVDYNDNGLSQCSISIDDNTANVKAVILTNNMNANAYYSCLKIERGNVPTDWTPAPEDVPSNDSNLVHKTGTETVAGNKTFTGSNIFTQLIDGYTKTSVAPNTDVNLITKSGKYELLTSNTNVPSGMPNNAILIVENNKETGTGSDVVYQRILSRDPKNIGGDSTIFFRMRFSSTWSGWRQVARDNEVVHNTGNETIAGDKTFTGKNTFTGQTSFWFKQIQWTSGIMQGTWYIQRMGNWVNAKFDMSANTGTGTTTISLPVGYRPLSQFVRDLEQGGAGISQNGTVLVANSYTGSNAMTFSYPTNDVWPTA